MESCVEIVSYVYVTHFKLLAFLVGLIYYYSTTNIILDPRILNSRVLVLVLVLVLLLYTNTRAYDRVQNPS